MLNRAGAPGQISMAELEKVLGQRPDLVIPFLPKQFANAAILGTPAVTGNRRVAAAIGLPARARFPVRSLHGPPSSTGFSVDEHLRTTFRNGDGDWNCRCRAGGSEKRRSSFQAPRPLLCPAPFATPVPAVPMLRLDPDGGAKRSRSAAAEQVRAAVLKRIDPAMTAAMPRDVLRVQLQAMIDEAASEERAQLNSREQAALAADLVDDMLGLGPIEPLLARTDITEIMVNGPNMVWVEIGGRLVLTDITFRDEGQLLNVCRRIVGAVGRRVDESSPICDARLQDGSRVSVVIPPLALDGPTLTIRKFAKERLTLEKLIGFKAMSRECATLLSIASRCRCNILVSGGTGSGKTTLLNCLTGPIDHGERIITIEDSAELQLQQPHVVRLETRPAQRRGYRRNLHARPRQGQPAYAARTHHHRRGARSGGDRPAAGHEHGPPRIDGNRSRQLRPRGAEPHREHGRDGGRQPSAPDGPRTDRNGHQPDRPGRPPARRQPQGGAGQRGGRHGG